MATWHDIRVPRHDEGRAARYLQSGSWSHETTVARFRVVVRKHGEGDAVVGVDGSMTYRELDARSDQVAAWLIHAGLPAGVPVVVQAGNSVESVLAFYSLLKAGAVPVAALAAHRSHEIGHITQMVQAAAHLIDTGVSDGVLVGVAEDNAVKHRSVQHLLAVGDAPAGFVRLMNAGHDVPPSEARSRVDAVQESIRHDHVAVYQLSGGTTGTPKVIPRLHAEYWNNALVNSRALGRSSRSRTAHVLPVLHNAGVINALFGAHSVGGCVVPLPFADAERTLTSLVDAGVTDMMLGGPMEPWFDHPLWDRLADTLEFLIYSGSKPPAALVTRVAGQGIWMGQTWGMAEGPYTSTPSTAPLELRGLSVGTPVFGTDDEMTVVDATTHVPLPDGGTGMLAFRGPSTLAGYFDAPGHNGEAFTADGYLLTGDLARLSEHAGVPYVFLEGRIKDVISRGGEKISTEEVEKLLRQHPAVDEAAVVAMPDARLGERACAYLALADPAAPIDLADVRAHFSALGVAKFKWPERLEILGALPRTPTFKIDKLELRRLVAQRIASEGGRD
jgi:2,3-dihydroxybenzoate-AMP ligase